MHNQIASAPDLIELAGLITKLHRFERKVDDLYLTVTVDLFTSTIYYLKFCNVRLTFAMLFMQLWGECKDRWSRIFRVLVEPGNARMVKNVPSGAYSAGIYLSPGGCQKTKLYRLGLSSGRFNFKRASRNCLAGELLKL